jgi:Sensors of blue-light using FAD
MSPLIHCIYASAARDYTDLALRDLLDQARFRNTQVGVSGMLLYTAGSFFQILEGAPEVVDATFARIAKDPRHGKVTVINREPIAHRSFEDWSMGYTSLSREDLGLIVGSNDFFEGSSCYLTLGSGRAKKLLRAFAQGRWREQLDVSAAA